MRCKECGYAGPQNRQRKSVYCAACKKKIVQFGTGKALLAAGAIALVVSAGVLLGYITALDRIKNPQQESAGCGDDSMAWVMARKSVKKSLLSPSSAKFSSTPVRREVLGNCSFFFGGDFESSNAFGVMIAQGFTVKITYNPKTDSYTASELFIWP